MTNTKTTKNNNLLQFATAGLQRTEVKIPSGQTIKLRALSVKEMKLLILANESESAQDFQVMQILSQCIETPNIDVFALSSIDVEYLYLQLHKISYGTSKVEAIFTCQNPVTKTVNGKEIEAKCSHKEKVMLNLNNAQVIGTAQSEIQITDDLSLIMRLPTLKEMEYFSVSTRDAFNLAMNCIKEIKTPNDVLIVGEHIEREELAELLEYMNANVYAKMIEFVGDLPTLQLHVPVKCSSCGHEEVLPLVGLSDFFA